MTIDVSDVMPESDPDAEQSIVPKQEHNTSADSVPIGERNPPPESQPGDEQQPPPLVDDDLHFDATTSADELCRQLKLLKGGEDRADFAGFVLLWRKLPRIHALKCVCSTRDEFVERVFKATGIKATQAYSIVHLGLVLSRSMVK